ncbi:MAG: hypothetical protein JRJ18_08380, partial [Deltaproteobacteria bacterium]|nr:hypothetical protein [Deltaproteobacteria bacterium]
IYIDEKVPFFSEELVFMHPCKNFVFVDQGGHVFIADGKEERANRRPRRGTSSHGGMDKPDLGAPMCLKTYSRRYYQSAGMNTTLFIPD